MKLHQAGLGSVSVPGFVLLCGGCAAVVAILVEAISGTPPVAAAFAAMAGYLPVTVGVGPRQARVTRAR